MDISKTNKIPAFVGAGIYISSNNRNANEIMALISDLSLRLVSISCDSPYEKTREYSVIFLRTKIRFLCANKL